MECLTPTKLLLPEGVWAVKCQSKKVIYVIGHSYDNACDTALKVGKDIGEKPILISVKRTIEVFQ
jgi:hypothetical protein